MEKIDNLTYSIQIDYKNSSNEKVSICRKMTDQGFEMNSIQIGDVCISEEMINGRILSGNYFGQTDTCGYRFNYEKNDEEYLTNTNDNIPLNITVDLINKTKMSPGFLSAKMVLGSILRQDYRLFSIDADALDITKTVATENKSGQKYFVQEKISLLKSKEEDFFYEKSKEKSCRINDNPVTEDASVKPKFKRLFKILDMNPCTYKDISLSQTKTNCPRPTLNL